MVSAHGRLRLMYIGKVCCQKHHRQMTDYMYLPWPPWAVPQKIEMILSLSNCPRRQRSLSQSLASLRQTLPKVTLLKLVNMPQHCLSHRHLSNIDSLMVHTTCLVCFISTVNGCSKKKENALEDVALVVGT